MLDPQLSLSCQKAELRPTCSASWGQPPQAFPKDQTETGTLLTHTSQNGPPGSDLSGLQVPPQLE